MGRSSTPLCVPHLTPIPDLILCTQTIPSHSRLFNMEFWDSCYELDLGFPASTVPWLSGNQASIFSSRGRDYISCCAKWVVALLLNPPSMTHEHVPRASVPHVQCLCWATLSFTGVWVQSTMHTETPHHLFFLNPMLPAVIRDLPGLEETLWI